MRNRINIAGILFLFCLILPFSGAYLWLQGRVQLAKMEANKYINSNQTDDREVVLTFANHDAESLLDWEHAREFSFNGLMYDVIHVELKEDSVTYHCFLDSKESKLKKDLDQMVLSFFRHSQQNEKQKQYILDFYKSIYLSENSSLINDRDTSQGTKCRDHYFSMHSTFLYNPPVPPPRILCLC